MRKMIVFSTLLLIGGLAFWAFRPSPPKVAEAEIHDLEEHEHDEDNLIAMSTDQMSMLDIKLQEAQPGTLSIVVSTRGKITLQPDQLAHILPKVSGVAKEARKNVGDEVKQGDILAIIESREMAEIKANFLASVEREKLAKSLLDREKNLFEKQISAKQDYLSAKSAYQEAKINVQLGAQKLQAFGIDETEIKTLSDQEQPNLRLYEVRAPIDGVIISRHITKGEFVEDTTTIYEVANLSKVWVQIGIYPKDILKVKKGQTVSVKLPVSGKETEAKIIYVSPIVEDETITSEAVAEIANPNRDWLPGTFVQVSIDTENIEASIVIPKDSIQEIDGESVVFVKTPEGFQKRAVTVGRTDNENAEILAGLNLGEEFAVTNTFLLKAELGKGEAEHSH
ncbi:MAG: efflux RND transporter periplasmic adaptor subunit [Chlamydiales bacterium]|nr:efflux RND transporter periplasmic adaptor subunit [Chlamydiales bacterium]